MFKIVFFLKNSLTETNCNFCLNVPKSRPHKSKENCPYTVRTSPFIGQFLSPEEALYTHLNIRYWTKTNS